MTFWPLLICTGLYVGMMSLMALVPPEALTSAMEGMGWGGDPA